LLREWVPSDEGGGAGEKIAELVLPLCDSTTGDGEVVSLLNELLRRCWPWRIGPAIMKRPA